MPGNPEDLAAKIALQIEHPERYAAPIDDWPALVANMDERLRNVLDAGRSSVTSA
jgi:hypothetical protein